MDIQGDNLLFVISLPRSGSTLLQHILAGHSAIAATPEPWILLSAVYTLRPGAVQADYDAETGRVALTEFLNQTGHGNELYYDALRTMSLMLYGAFLKKEGKCIFLDKTSRNYLILPELFRIFPDARYLFLVRNPLAVLSSFLETMVHGDWRLLGVPAIRNDLLKGYSLLRQGIWYFGDNAHIVRYEDLVMEPENTVAGICENLGMDFEPQMISYGTRVGVLPGRLVDPRSIHRHQAPVTDYLDTWRLKLIGPQEKQIAHGFLSHLGPDLVNELGYSYTDLDASIGEQPRGDGTPVIDWNSVMSIPEQRTLLQRFEMDVAYAWQQRGKEAGLRRAAYFVGRPAASHSYRTLRDILKRSEVVSDLRERYPYTDRIVRAIQRKGTSVQTQPTSADYQILTDSAQPLDLSGWHDEDVSAQQLSAYLPLLEQIYECKPRQDFSVAAQALRLTGLSSASLLEIGCGNGYYAEVLEFLTDCPINYTGIDYSLPMVISARKRYPHLLFLHGDATDLPFEKREFDIAWSGTALMHIPNYEQAIAETCRVSRRFSVFHSTPVLGDHPTTYLTKNAYGAPVIEILINREEIESIFHRNGLIIRHILPSLPYQVAAINATIHTLTYVCEKVS